MKGRAIYLLLFLGFLSVALAKECLTDDEANGIVSRWTSLVIKIDVKVVNETVNDNFQFFSDSQDFLEGLPVSFLAREISGSPPRKQSNADSWGSFPLEKSMGSANGVPSIANETDLIQQQTVAQAPGTPVIPISFTILETYHSCRTITFPLALPRQIQRNTTGLVSCVLSH
jgi:hypothetical protein